MYLSMRGLAISIQAREVKHDFCQIHSGFYMSQVILFIEQNFFFAYIKTD